MFDLILSQPAALGVLLGVGVTLGISLYCLYLFLQYTHQADKHS